MDTTHAESEPSDGRSIDTLLERLEKADPAQAPAIAEELAATLAGAVDGDNQIDGSDSDGTTR
jgi:hypothetical protein